MAGSYKEHKDSYNETELFIYSMKSPTDNSEAFLKEVKNVAYQAFTNQLNDFLLWTEQEGIDFILATRASTVLSSKIQELIEAGKIIHDTFKWP